MKANHQVVYALMRGGRVYHIRNEGSDTALCGARPRANRWKIVGRVKPSLRRICGACVMKQPSQGYE